MTNSTRTVANDENAPFLIQGSDGPVFRSREPSDTKFVCTRCEMTLIEGYFEECFIGVAIQCNRCKIISRTPALDPGEVLPVPIITLGNDGKYLIGGTVDYNRTVVMTTDRHIADNNERCAPRIKKAKFELSEEYLNNLSQRFANLSDTDPAKRLAELKRYHSGGRSGSLELPFDWSLWKILDCLKSKIINLDDAHTNIALGRLYLFHTVDAMWGNHPRYATVCKEFSNTKAFFHTIGQFIIAAYYYDNKIPVGFSVENVFGEKKPDLYIRLNAERRFYFEFKSPSSLIWDGSSLSRAEIKKNINSIIRNSGQINKSRPGVFVLMANYPDPEINNVLQQELRSFFEHKGRYKPYVAGAVAMHCGSVTRENSSSGLDISMMFNFENLENRFCELPDNPFRREEDR